MSRDGWVMGGRGERDISLHCVLNVQCVSDKVGWGGDEAVEWCIT